MESHVYLLKERPKSNLDVHSLVPKPSPESMLLCIHDLVNTLTEFGSQISSSSLLMKSCSTEMERVQHALSFRPGPLASYPGSLWMPHQESGYEANPGPCPIPYCKQQEARQGGYRGCRHDLGGYNGLE